MIPAGLRAKVSCEAQAARLNVDGSRHTGTRTAEMDDQDGGPRRAPGQPRQGAPDQADEALLRDALDAIGEAFVIYGPDGRLVLCNQNFREIYGYSAAEARPGVHFQELGRIDVERGNVVVGDEYGCGEEYLARKAEYRRRLQGSFIVQLKDGRWLKTTDRRTSNGGFVSVQSDVTELKQAEAAMAAAKTAAEMSHELRTPLNAILGFSELLSEAGAAESDPDRVRGYARSIHQSGQLLLQLIEEILDLAKIESGRLEIAEEELDPAAAIDECLTMVRPRAQAAGVALDGAAAPDVPQLRADGRALRQILLNLLTNAVKFTPEGGAVALSAAPEGGGVAFTVTDTGVGIAEADLARILEPFEQVSGSYARNRDGTGLGLPIAKALTEAHGGRLELDSAPERGTRVTVRLPAERTLAAR
jgi:two-component system cell cycle sensor histidine kinase PleC